MSKVTPLAVLLFPVFLITMPGWLLIWATKGIQQNLSVGHFISGLIIITFNVVASLIMMLGPGPDNLVLPKPVALFVSLNILECLIWALWSFVWMPFYWNFVGGQSYETD